MESYVYAFYLIQCDNKGNFSFDLNEKSESWSSRKSITQYTMMPYEQWEAMSLSQKKRRFRK